MPDADQNIDMRELIDRTYALLQSVRDNKRLRPALSKTQRHQLDDAPAMKLEMDLDDGRFNQPLIEALTFLGEVYDTLENANLLGAVWAEQERHLRAAKTVRQTIALAFAVFAEMTKARAELGQRP